MILAQAGSFVPASSASVGIVDAVFSRVGASDDISRNRSTFMVEMMETSMILKHATHRYFFSHLFFGGHALVHMRILILHHLIHVLCDVGFTCCFYKERTQIHGFYFWKVLNCYFRSLLVMDEIGRGTSPTDGLAIAQSVIEYIHEYKKSRTLFATHFHELSELTKYLPNLKCFHMKVLVDGKSITFLHHVCNGQKEQ